MYYVHSAWAYFLAWGVITGIGNNAKMLPVEVAITNWFVKKRGLAMGIRWTLNGLAGVVVVPLVAWLIVRQGWRTTCLFGGLITLVVGLPLAWFSFKNHRPEYYGLLPDGATSQAETVATSQTARAGREYAAEVGETEFTLKQAMRTPAFWLLVAGGTANSLAFPVLTIHTIPFLTDIGMKPLQAAGMLSMLIFIGLPFRLMGGVLADRFRKSHLRLLLAVAYLMQAIGFSAYLLNQTIPMIYVWFIFYGIGNGFAYGPQTPIWGRYFGRKAFGSIRGTANMLMTPIGIIARVDAGWMYDTTSSYIAVFITVAVGLILAAVLTTLARPPKAPAQISDVRQIF